MGKIRILQLHNLAIGALLEESPFQAIGAALKKCEGLEQKVDYLVLCGNLTRDASPQSFEHAGKVLRDMVREFLPGRVRTANRVLIVPGRFDVPDPEAARPDFELFRQFHDRFFQEEFGIDRRFDPGRAELRKLKDLTLIGITYWSSRDRQLCEERIRCFGASLAGAMSRMPRLAYVKATPTLLVSSGNPLFRHDDRWPAPDPLLQEIFHRNLKISCHLFGSGPAAWVPPVPFAYEHVGLGLGPQGDAGLWPLQVNLIELGSDDPEAPPGGPNLTWTALHQPSQARDWECRTYSIPLASENPPNLELELDELYSDFLDRLKDKVLQPETRILRVQGFPGSGLRDLFKQLTREESRRIGGRQMRIHGYEWSSSEAWKDFLSKLPTSMEGVAARLVVVRDPRFHLLENAPKLERIKELSQDFEAFDRRFKLVHFEDFSSLTVDLEGCDELPVLSTDGIANLARRYAYRVPLQSDELAHITGGYAGFSQRFLQAAREGFANWSGDRDIDERTPLELLRSSFSVEEVTSTCERFLHTVKYRISGGGEVFDHVRKEVVTRYEGLGSEASPLGRPIEVDFGEFPQPRFKPGARKATSLLERFDILRRTNLPHRYEVRLVAPFLSRSECFVFFSYPAEERECAEKVKTFLQERGRLEKTHLEVFTYTQDRPEPTSDSLPEDLMRFLEATNNLCVFHSGGPSLEGWTRYEVDGWLEIWRPEPSGDSAFIPILLGDPSGKLPAAFLGNNGRIPARGLDEREIADRIFNRLVYKREMRWGWD